MDDAVKICPECGAEYFAHVTECKGCEVKLVEPGQKAAAPVRSTGGSLVCIEEGEYDRMNELAKALAPSGIEYKVLNARAGGSSCSGSGFGIFVQQAYAREAVRIIEESWRRLHPEIIEAEERMASGLCPACGASLKGSEPECPDCGLNLGGGPDACGGCGPGSCH